MDSPSAVEKIALRHRKAFATSGFFELTSTLPTYMVIDDHEIADNWSRDLLVPGQPGLAATARATAAQRLFFTARASFAAYQWAHGPRNSTSLGFYYHFEEGGCSFFVLDTRCQRLRFEARPQICNPAQLDELKNWLLGLENDARPKFVISGSVLAPGLREADTGQPGLSDLVADNWQMAQRQRQELLDCIAQSRRRNVVFLSGDYHCSAVARLAIGEMCAYAIVTPPLYAPLPAANVKPDEVLQHEVFSLPGGARVVVETCAVASGDGFADLRVIPLPRGRWRLEVTLHQLDASQKLPSSCAQPVCFDLG
jgi:hypothetical protein